MEKERIEIEKFNIALYESYLAFKTKDKKDPILKYLQRHKIDPLALIIELTPPSEKSK